MSKENIINTWDQNVAAGGDRIVIWRRHQERGRAYRCASWGVGRFLNGKTLPTDPDPKAAWYDYGKKTFDLTSFYNPLCLSIHAFRKARLQEAIAWANEMFGPREFVKNRLGDYVEKEVNEKFPIPKREKS